MMMRKAAAVALVQTVMQAYPSIAASVDAPDVHNGQAQFDQVCAICHTKEPAKNKIGPSLFGLIGRKSGSAPGFSYSDAMKNSGIVWDAQSLDKYLADPKAAVPGNKMPYAGVKRPELRKDIIAYLSTLQ